MLIEAPMCSEYVCIASIFYWCYYIRAGCVILFNSFSNWARFGGNGRNLGVPSLFLPQSLLRLIGFMVCLNCTSPEDNRSLQCFKLNYRCCKVCSEKDCKDRLLPSQQLVWGSCVCPSYPSSGRAPPCGVQPPWLQEPLL